VSEFSLSIACSDRAQLMGGKLTVLELTEIGCGILAESFPPPRA